MELHWAIFHSKLPANCQIIGEYPPWYLVRFHRALPMLRLWTFKATMHRQGDGTTLQNAGGLAATRCCTRNMGTLCSGSLHISCRMLLDHPRHDPRVRLRSCNHKIAQVFVALPDLKHRIDIEDCRPIAYYMVIVNILAISTIRIYEDRYTMIYPAYHSLSLISHRVRLSRPSEGSQPANLAPAASALPGPVILDDDLWDDMCIHNVNHRYTYTRTYMHIYIYEGYDIYIYIQLYRYKIIYIYMIIYVYSYKL